MRTHPAPLAVAALLALPVLPPTSAAGASLPADEVRCEASSSFPVEPTDDRAFALLLDPTLGSAPDTAPPAAAFLSIDDLESGAALATTSDSKPGRGLEADGITTPCSALYDETDLDFLHSIAQRTVRPRACNRDSGTPRAYDVVGGVFRDASTGISRIALRAIDPSDGALRGRLALRVEAPRAADGGLAAGRVEIVPGCDALGCTEGPAHSEVHIVPPAFPGAPNPPERTWSAAAAGAARVAWTPAGADPASASVSWNLLLRDTSWNPAGFVKGVALSPRGFPDDFSRLPEFFAEAAGFRDAGVLWNGSWLSGVRETGWPAETSPDQPVPWQVSPAAQVAYVHRLFGLLRGHDGRGVVWLYLYPPVDDGSLDRRLFGSISLRDRAGARRPVYDAWAAK